MKNLLEKIEKVQNTIEQLNINEMEVNMKFTNVDKNELIRFAVHGLFMLDKYETELGVVYSLTCEVCDQLTVVFETNYLPKI